MDWIRFLEENNIHYVTRGPNTKKGEVSIACPMCGAEDPSEHLGINLKTEKWGCHRDASHRGKKPNTLIRFILGCSTKQAKIIVKQYNHSDPDTLEAALTVLEADTKGAIQHDEDLAKLARHQQLGPQFNDFNKIKVRGITRRFFDYLASRGFEDTDALIKHYDLRCALTGRYKDRIIIPIRQNGELLGWTSRAIGSPKNAPRYLASSEDVKTTVFNYDELKEGGKRLFIVEGPFDALKMDNHGRHLGVRTTCTFGTSVTISQLVLLRILVKKFDDSWILFDQGAEGPADNLVDWIDSKIATLAYGIKDPGEFKREHLNWACHPSFHGHFQEFSAQNTYWMQNTLIHNNALLRRLKHKW